MSAVGSQIRSLASVLVNGSNPFRAYPNCYQLTFFVPMKALLIVSDLHVSSFKMLTLKIGSKCYVFFFRFLIIRLS